MGARSIHTASSKVVSGQAGGNLKNLIFVGLGLLIGLSLVQYGVLSAGRRSSVQARTAKALTTEVLKEQLMMNSNETSSLSGTLDQEQGAPSFSVDDGGNSRFAMGPGDSDKTDAILSKALQQIQSQSFEPSDLPFGAEAEESLLEEIEKEQLIPVLGEKAEAASDSHLRK
jgi:hypothetical protein